MGGGVLCAHYPETTERAEGGRGPSESFTQRLRKGRGRRVYPAPSTLKLRKGRGGGIHCVLHTETTEREREGIHCVLYPETTERAGGWGGTLSSFDLRLRKG